MKRVEKEAQKKRRGKATEKSVRVEDDSEIVEHGKNVMAKPQIAVNGF